ncbi:MAG: ABC transporter permease subunit [Eubacteriales bacterium]|nr:ABC transporter permease subunit [Eubacteriales bacterium]
MRKLLRADFMRLWKDRVFRLFLVLFCVGGAFLPILHAIQNKNGTENWTMDDGFFVFVTVVSVALSVFAALFVGSAYSDGTMRNKVVVGHSRCAIYLSHLLVTMTAGLLFALAYVVTELILGFLLLGGFVTEPIVLAMTAGAILCLLFAYSAIFVLVAMLCQNKAYTTAITILLTCLLLLNGVRIISALNEPEYYGAYSFTENGVTVTEDMEKNPNYLSGTKRQAYEFLNDFLPGGQTIRLSNLNAENPPLLAAYSLCILAAATGIGLCFFRRRDLK